MSAAETNGTSLSYLVFEVRDREAWDAFLTRFVGVLPSGVVAGASRYRTDAQLARLIVREGPADDLYALGFALPDEPALAAAIERAVAAGSRVTALSQDELDARAVAEGYRTYDAAGNAVELVRGPELADAPFHSELARDGFVTGDLGLGHLALRAEDIEASRHWYEKVLGFRLSDRIECDLPGGLHVDLTFLHVNRRHHTLALGRALPKRLHHFMLEFATLDDVGASLDRARAARVPIVLGLGRHPNDRMASFYCITPSGFELELGTGGRTIDDEARWTPRVYDRISEWGHMPPPRPKRTASEHAGNRSDR